LLFDSPAQTRFLLPHISRGIIEARRPLAKRCVVQARHHTWKPAREKIRQGHHPVDESLGPKIKLGHKYTPTRSSCYFPWRHENALAGEFFLLTPTHVPLQSSLIPDKPVTTHEEEEI